ncbi:MAG: carbonic anhydrase [Endomicrobia bacterium]|nr:carbonic anhydrase [Endomicrobiia bacterium]MCL2506158.1 carbonic anhydrase [Endomicrobiia bacterium]
MSNLEEILEFNKKFVEEKRYEAYPIAKYPNKKLAILSCMDARLTKLLPAALNLKNGDAKIITNAGAIITHPFGSVMRSLLIAIYALGVEEILVIAHYDCGVQGMDASKLTGKMTDRNIGKEKLDFINCCGVDINKWLKGFDSVEESVVETVKIIKNHPLLPEGITVNGLVIDPETGRLDKVNC